MPPERRTTHRRPAAQAPIADFLRRPNLNLQVADTSSLNQEQKKVYDGVLAGAGTFITGDAGA